MDGNKLKSEKGVRGNIDPVTTAVPLAVVLLLCISFTVCPEVSAGILMTIREFLGDTLGIWYLAVGLAVLLISFWIAFSDIGKITLGEKGEKPKYGFLAWGAMIFTCGLAADILFYSFCEWICYAQEPHVSEAGSVQDWASTYPLFHWGPIPWSFYAVLAACFGFMLHVRNVRKQKYSEACRPLLGSQTDRGAGKIIDILAVIALIAGTTTTFSVATPLLSAAIADLAGIQSSKYITIMILVITCFIYTFAVMKDLKGVSGLANICMYLFGALLIYVLVFGGETRYILETGFSAVGNMIQNFIVLSTWTDALRVSSFPQNWTIFYWAYWMVWCVASPFFMGSISRGRTVKQVILGAYTFGLGSTLLSFIILGNYGLGLQMTGRFDGISFFNQCGDLYQTVMAIIRTLPACPVFLILLTVSMIAFYATSFDSITLVASQYSYREFREGEKAGNGMKFFWAVLLILLPVTFVFSESSMKNMQTVSIIAAFPVSIVIILIIVSFVKDAKKYLYEEQ